MKKAPGRLSSIRNTVKKLTERLSDEHSEEGGMHDEQREKEKLLVQIRSLEEEVRRLSQTRAQLEQVHKQNDRLTEALQQTDGRVHRAIVSAFVLRMARNASASGDLRAARNLPK